MTDKTATTRKRRGLSKVRLLKEVLKYLDEETIAGSEPIDNLTDRLERSIVKEAMDKA